MSWQLTVQKQLCISLAAARLLHARQSAPTKYQLAFVHPTAYRIIKDEAGANENCQDTYA